MPAPARLWLWRCPAEGVDAAAQVGPLLDQLTGSLAVVIADGAYDPGWRLRRRCPPVTQTPR
jgi:hypothetical protein